jgi:dipeptidyl-peptidase-4
MMRRALVVLVFLGLSAPLPAQPPKVLTSDYLRDHALTQGFSLGRPGHASPSLDGKAILFLRAQARVPAQSLYEFDIATQKTRLLLDPVKLAGDESGLTPEEKAERERRRVRVGGFSGFQMAPDGDHVLLSLSGKLWFLQRSTGKTRPLDLGPGGVYDARLSPDGRQLAFIRDHDLFTYDLDTNKVLRLTTGGNPQLTHGLAEFVAQEEMDRHQGYWWSPDGKALVYQESDALGVETWHLADPAEPGKKPTTMFYPRPGKLNVDVRLGMIPAVGGKTTWIEWDRNRFPYLATVRWTKGGLILVVQSRSQQDLALLKADPATGKTTQLLTEHDDTWINLDQQMPIWLEDGSGFLWTSERDGAWQLELRTPQGRLRRVLISPEYRYRGLVGLDLERRLVYFTASLNPTQLHLFKMGLSEDSDPEPMTKGEGIHQGSLFRGGALMLRTAKTMAAMPRTTVHDVEGRLLGALPSVAEEPGFSPSVDLVQVGRAPGYQAAVTLPQNFDARKRYPVLVDVYGGPHLIHVTAQKQRWLLNQWYADQGFIVAAIDNRGTPGRGRDWERAIHKQFAFVPLDDQVLALKALGERYPAMDLERVGMHGASFGGYMAALAALKRPEIFQAAVARCPVTDWLDYDTHYTERYLGVPAKNQEHKDDVYFQNSLLSQAGKLSRPLLLVHGTADDNVFFRHTLKLADAIYRQGKDVEVLPQAGLTHQMYQPDAFMGYHQRVARFFQKHLGTPR